MGNKRDYELMFDFFWLPLYVAYNDGKIGTEYESFKDLFEMMQQYQKDIAKFDPEVRAQISRQFNISLVI